MPTYDLVNAEAGQRDIVPRAEHGAAGSTRWSVLLQQLSQLRGRLRPQRADPPFIAFAMQTDPRLGAEVEVLGPKVGRFLYPRAAVI